MLIRIGTRSSALALWQANAVRDMIVARFPECEVQLEIMNTTGDLNLTSPLGAIGDKGLFTKELETALLDGSIDCAVHSLKDMQTVLPEGLMLAAVTERHRAEDALVAVAGMTLDTLPHGATVATGSVRRRAQLLALRPDLNTPDVRGNVPTRLQKYRENGWDGIILAAAGLERLELGHEIAQIIPPSVMIPAVGQGALGIESRSDDPDTQSILRALEHTPTRSAADAERALLRTLEGGCSVPVGAHATLHEHALTLHAVIAARNGSATLRDSIQGNAVSAETLGVELAVRMLEGGGKELLGR